MRTFDGLLPLETAVAVAVGTVVVVAGGGDVIDKAVSISSSE